MLAYCREKGIKAFDLRFVDVLGSWRHITFPVSALTEACFEEGFGHDIVLDQSDGQSPSHAILVPQGVAHYLDPFTHQPVAAPFAAKVLVPKSLREESLRAFLRRLTEKEEDILAYVSEAVKATGANRNTLKAKMAELVDEGLLTRHGQGRGVYYTKGRRDD